MDGPGGWRRPSRSVMTKMMKESVKTGHPTGLPEKLLRLFAPNPPLRYVKENCKPRKKPAVPITGIASLVGEFAAPGDAEYEPRGPSADFPEPRETRNKEYALQVRLDEETKPEKKKRLAEWRAEKNKKDLEEKAAHFNPNDDPMIEGDPYKTLFVSRLSYEVTERKLRHEFEEFGPIRRIRLVHAKNSEKPRGYAFIEYEHKKDMKEAYKMSDGRKIETRRILVDVERGRTVENWRPMRLGGGLGGDSRAPKEPRKKLLADAVAKGLAPPQDESRPIIRRDEPRGPPRDYDRPPPRDFDRGPPRDMRGPPPDRFDRGPPRDMRGPPPGYEFDRDREGRGGFEERERVRDRERDRDRGFDRDYRDRGERDRGDRDRGDRDRDREKRPREPSPGRDYKRGRRDDEPRRRSDRDY